MPDVARRTRPSIDAATAMYAGQISGLVAGEDIAEGDFTKIRASDGRLIRTTGVAGEVVAGMAPRTARTGEPLTIYGINTRAGYGTALTPGQALYLSATAGRLGDAAAVAGNPPVAVAVNATDILIIRAA